MSDVKRYTNCVVGMPGVEMVLASDYATLEAELAKLRAGQEPVAYITGQFAGRCVIEAINRAAVLPTGMALYSAPQPSAVPDGWKLAVDNVAGYAHLYNSGSGIIHEIRAEHARLLAAAPSAPATVQGVNAQLLEALEELIYAHTDKAKALATAAIAAARQEGGKV